MSIIDDRSTQDFLTYANSVIKSRAIPRVEDNLKPIHRKILWTMYEDKLFPDKNTTKCASIVGDAMHYSPHGDASVYGALVRLGQWWKLRYPLVEIQGNAGNLLGDSAAASRYTEAKLTPIGMLMLEDINRDCVEMKPNYSGETMEPATLPSRFPWILCGNNSGIAVGMSSDIVSHNFTEVAEGIKYYIDNPSCTTADLMQFIKGPDFPTGGMILNGDDLLNIYTTGRGAVKVAAHYDVINSGGKTSIIFKDLPYGVEIESGIKTPVKKLVLEDGYDVFEDINVEKAGPRNFNIKITLSRGANISKCLELLFSKTRLADTVKINNTFIVNGEPRLLSLKDMIVNWVNYRSNIILKISRNQYEKVSHKLTVVIGLQKCMSNIDKLIQLIRSAANDTEAKNGIIKEFTLTDEQATAVLEIKLGRLSRIDIQKLNDEQKELEDESERLINIINNEPVRFKIIKQELDEIKQTLGADERLTEIYHSVKSEQLMPREKQLINVYSDGLHDSNGTVIDNNIIDVVFTNDASKIFGYSATGELQLVNAPAGEIIGAFTKDTKNKLVTVTRNGNIKVTNINEYKLTKSGEKLIKLKDGDELAYADLCDDNDYLILFDGGRNVLKLSIKDLPTAGKLTMGVKSGFKTICAATVVNESDKLLFVTADNKGKFTAVKDFSTDSRGNKGQMIVENIKFMRRFDDIRTEFYAVPQQGKVLTINKNKISLKGKSAIGATISSKAIRKII